MRWTLMAALPVLLALGCAPAQLHERNQKQGLPDLYIVTTDLSHARWEVLSHESVPCMPVALAMRLSGSLPLIAG